MSWHCPAAVYLIQRSCLCHCSVTTELDKLYVSRLKNQRGQWVCRISTSRKNAQNAGGRDHRARFMNTGHVSTPCTHFVRASYKVTMVADPPLGRRGRSSSLVLLITQALSYSRACVVGRVFPRKTAMTCRNAAATQ